MTVTPGLPEDILEDARLAAEHLALSLRRGEATAVHGEFLSLGALGPLVALELASTLSATEARTLKEAFADAIAYETPRLRSRRAMRTLADFSRRRKKGAS